MVPTIRELQEAYAAGTTTARAVVDAALADIHARDPEIGALLETYDADARASADAVDAARARGEQLGPLAGIPFVVKDNMVLMGRRSSCASKMLADYRGAMNATAVQRLLDAGAMLIGRANMDEFAMGSSTETSAWQLTKNPHDLTKVPGGSSGGSAAAVAAGFVPFALGSDTGGSIRQPAALCGIVGHKPTYGRVSRFGLIALSSSLDQIGPFARTAEDAALVLRIMEGRDQHDATSLDIAQDAWTPRSNGMTGLRIGVPKEYFGGGVDPKVEEAVRAAIAVLVAQGATVTEISLPLSSAALPTYYILQPAEASSNLARFDGLRYGTRAPGTLEESYLHARGDGFGEEVKRRIILGSFILSSGYHDAFYKKGVAVQAALRREFADAFAQVDVIIGPTSPTVAWNLGERMNDPIAMYMADILTVAANIAGVPALSIPCGMSDGLPIGLQLHGAHGADALLLQVAQAYQAATAWHTMAPSL